MNGHIKNLQYDMALELIRKTISQDLTASETASLAKRILTLINSGIPNNEKLESNLRVLQREQPSVDRICHKYLSLLTESRDRIQIESVREKISRLLNNHDRKRSP